MGFLGTMKKFFGLRTNQSPIEFGKEVNQLSYEEKMEFHRMLNATPGYECDAPTPPATQG